MSPSPKRTVRTALIPWVIALVALFGLNVFAPDHSNPEPGDSPEEIGLSQLPHHAQKAGRIFNPQVFLAPATSDGIGSTNRTSLFLCIESRRDLTVIPAHRGAVQGRAPPIGRLA